MKTASRTGQAGFTLIEMLIVIVILGILAMVIIPQISTSTDDARLSALRTNLSAMRNAVEIYYAQHNSTYPGIAGAAVFVLQLTQYTDAAGAISATKDATHKFGPYIKGSALGKNPFNELNTILVDAAIADITVRTGDGSTGWKFFAITGVLIANDGAHYAE